MRQIRIQDPVTLIRKKRKRFLCPIEDCTYEKASKEGYLTRRGYNNHFVNFHRQSETVGFLSRLDWGSPGFRKGLVDLAFQQFEREKVRFLVLAGGLVSFPHLKKQLTVSSLRVLAIEHSFVRKNANGKEVPDIAKAKNWLLGEWTSEIAQVIPQLKLDGRKLVRMYIISSPTTNYDGWVGSEIARRLTRIRPDIRFWGERSVRLPLKRQKKVIWVLCPIKGSWRGKYFSTTVDRLIEDELKQSSHDMPDIWVVGCGASSLQRPKGEQPRPYISLPALHVLQEVSTSENQVGIRVMEFIPQTDEFLVRTYNFKDYTADERDWIPDPKDATDLQLQVVSALKSSSTHTIGMLEDALQVPRGQIATAINDLNKAGYQPAIILDEVSKLYNFDSWWIQNQLSYPKVDPKDLNEETILGFGCLHAGSIYTEYRWFVEEVPRIILEQGSTSLVAAGDLIEGLEWDLDKKGEVMGGFNYTQQERFAARMICSVMLKVLEVRLREALKGYRRRTPSADELTMAVENSLLQLYFIPGNHCGWVKRKGITPLATFEPALVNYLYHGVSDLLADLGFKLPGLNLIVEKKVVQGEDHTLPSGLQLKILHPHMARALTSSLRAQHALNATNTQILILANFHVAISVDQWDADLGQRVAVQCGAIVWKTSFEAGKLKTLDVGVAHLSVLSNNEGRVLVTETAFFGGGKKKAYENEFILQGFMRDIGI